MKYTIRETNDFEELAQLYYDSDLEITLGEAPHGKIIKNWRCTDENGRLIAGATLMYKGELCVVEYIAVAEDMRGSGLGSELLHIAEEEAKAINVRTLWLCGKVPEFYKKYDWEPVDNESAPPISVCQDCEDFHVSCFPIIMKKEFA